MSVVTIGGRVVQFASPQHAREWIEARARQLHPERYAPDGTPLMRYPGRGWGERLRAWERDHEDPAGAPIPEGD